MLHVQICFLLIRRKSVLHVQFVFLLIRSISFIVVPRLALHDLIFFCLHVLLTRASLLALAKSIYYFIHATFCLLVICGGLILSVLFMNSFDFLFLPVPDSLEYILRQQWKSLFVSPITDIKSYYYGSKTCIRRDLNISSASCAIISSASCVNL